MATLHSDKAHFQRQFEINFGAGLIYDFLIEATASAVVGLIFLFLTERLPELLDDIMRPLATRQTA
jgi:hypothetical protein